jgi:hypothetical protein
MEFPLETIKQVSEIFQKKLCELLETSIATFDF